MTGKKNNLFLILPLTKDRSDEGGRFFNIYNYIYIELSPGTVMISFKFNKHLKLAYLCDFYFIK